MQFRESPTFRKKDQLAVHLCCNLGLFFHIYDGGGVFLRKVILLKTAPEVHTAAYRSVAKQ
jgi:hypothetical protein